MISPTDQAAGERALVRVALVASLVSLVLSGAAFIGSLDDDESDRRTEARLACLELPGANDCGLDAR